MSNTSFLLDQANLRLKRQGVSIRICQSGLMLSLRGILPPRPGAEAKGKHQQRIPLKCPTTAAGIAIAEERARRVQLQVLAGCFFWDDHIDLRKTKSATVADLIREFEADYFNRRKRSPKSETTWRIDYAKTFARLPQHSILTPELLLDMVRQTEPDSRTRLKFCQKLQALADFAEIEVNLKPYQGSYSGRRVNPRNLPSDKLIALWHSKIENDQWRFAYGLLATYGLRNHEIFLVDLEQLQRSPVVHLLDGKTGPRHVWPLYPEWYEQFELSQGRLPSCTGGSNADLGARVTHFFQRLNSPFRAYDLRHAWAVRAIELGLDISLAAQQMGHSARVHCETYHHWVGYEVHQRAFSLIKSRQTWG